MVVMESVWWWISCGGDGVHVVVMEFMWWSSCGDVVHVVAEFM